MARRPLIRSMTAPALAGLLTATVLTAAPADAASALTAPSTASASAATLAPAAATSKLEAPAGAVHADGRD